MVFAVYLLTLGSIMLYFAYGSNLNWQQMNNRCPNSEFICRALLTDHRLGFTHYATEWGGGVADILWDPNRQVWGVVYRVNETDRQQLDVCEGYYGPEEPNEYDRICLTVLQEGHFEKRLSVIAYRVADPSESDIPPSRGYLAKILAGAEHWKLPAEYLNVLRQIQPKD